mgnify:CR=1 FL=1|tara:strand:+ start:23649 stop:23843 length:195 start_codon:yes stop_codon:yes gene_type:complete
MTLKHRITRLESKSAQPGGELAELTDEVLDARILALGGTLEQAGDLGLTEQLTALGLRGNDEQH